MSLKNLLGLGESNITEFEIMAKITQAQKNNLENVEFIREDGSIIRISLPNIEFDPHMDVGS